MALYLQPDVALRIREGNVVLERNGVDVSHVLGVAEAIAIACLATTGDQAAATEICDEVFSGASGWVTRAVDRYWTYLGEGPARDLDYLWLAEVCRLQPTFPLLPDSRIRQEAAPAAITWMVTLGCNRRCPYCFFDVYRASADSPSDPPDATFPVGDVARMVREMARIGAADLYLTGGEPLLRRDLPEIIAEASRVRVRTHLNTKFLIDGSLSKRLAQSKLTSVSVSLDDARPTTAAALAGAHGYLAEATDTLHNLLEAGLNVEVNAVVTKLNAEAIEGLAVWLADHGVERLRLSQFHAPYPRRVAAERLSVAVDPSAVARELARKFADRNLQISVGNGGAWAGSKPCDSAVCEIGTRALDVMPDGSASRCHYLAGTESMRLPSLRTNTLLEVWRGPALAALARPPRSAFTDTACNTCGGHDACNSRGRCYLSSLTEQQKLHAPDAYCTRP
jgi:MoaA/NifB/PqqE/SkfB family radical SAM enzyme